ncbi:hypothetical protein P170DRAFT_477391 [Aspergillus steynii IBT 23096]|uniref:F-box domain-containing protein n=1 Tax=Aspergillus steynii IBT 23096 TaxID=1392250 RepID=A0A2I2G0X0_9EURO|nr:uncharacterized protein P170DRAFT_477391 [Aspergillus steynii IBT 23096]PLB46511.1 hypothetical protein P170DRAFT_477391 [Aspergillus steynii IBT 23096]
MSMPSQSSSDAPESFIQRLPNELLILIFEQLHPATEKYPKFSYWLNPMLVCRRWYPIAEEVACASTTLYIERDPDATTRVLINKSQTRRYVRSVRFNCNFAAESLRARTLILLQSLKRVRCLILDSGFPIKDNAMLAAFREMPLTELHITYLLCPYSLLEFSNIPTLRRLALNNWGDFIRERWRRGAVPRRRPPPRFDVDLDNFLPPRKQRTSRITTLRFKKLDIPADLLERLFMWPADLESVELDFLPRTPRLLTYTAERIQDMLAPRAASLKNVRLGALHLNSRRIPDFSSFNCLETLTVYGANLLSERPEIALQKLATPSLKLLIIDLRSDSEIIAGRGKFPEVYRCWLESFFKGVKGVSRLSGLKNVQIYTYKGLFKEVRHLPSAQMVDNLVQIAQECGIFLEDLSGNLVPLTVIKGAGHEFIPLPQGENATTADFHSIRTKTESPAYFTSGFYKIEAGPQRPAHYTFEETKYVLNGQIDVLDEATGITHHLVPGDFAFFHVGSKVKFSTKSSGFAFYAVTRPVRAPHPNLVDREEKQAKL